MHNMNMCQHAVLMVHILHFTVNSIQAAWSSDLTNHLELEY